MINTSLSGPTERFVLTCLKQGEEKAFDYIFRQYYKALCSQANLYVHDLDLSQSLVQDCFIRLWEIREEATDIDNLGSWLCVLVRNKCVDYLRKYRRESVFDRTEVEQKEGGTDLLGQVFSHEFEERLILALNQLPERCRVAFEYSRFDGLTYPEIASRMNISVKAVEALISRSLKILRVELSEFLPLIFLLFGMPE
ncbi:MAG: RNA polymerase sigma-70 factor [Mangrovibacterium sp.]